MQPATSVHHIVPSMGASIIHVTVVIPISAANVVPIMKSATPVARHPATPLL
jgi:hypothetical protein